MGGSRFVKKAAFLTAFAFLLLAGTLVAQSESRDYISDYEIMDLDFLRTHYTEIDNGRPIQVEGTFDSYKWLPPYDYKSRLSRIGDNIEDYNLVQMTIEEKDGYHYSFPILIFHTAAGDLHQLDQLSKGLRVVIYGRFYNLMESEYAIAVDVIELAQVSSHVDPVGTPVWKTGGHDTVLLLDGRISPTPTPSPTVTPTPQPSLLQKIGNLVNPKETVTPSTTSTPGT